MSLKWHSEIWSMCLISNFRKILPNMNKHWIYEHDRCNATLCQHPHICTWIFLSIFFLFSTLCILKVNRNFAFDQRTQLSAETETWTCLFHKTRAHKGSCLCPGRRESNIFEAYILKHSEYDSFMWTFGLLWQLIFLVFCS